MAGLTSTGFVPKTYEEIKADLEAAFRASFGASINVTPASNFGKIIAITAERLAELWEVAEAVHAAQTPDGSTGVALDDVASLTGTVRLPASKSSVTLTLTGTPGTLVPAGRVVSTGAGVRFVTLADATIGGGGTITAAAEAEDTGPFVAYAGTLTNIETPVAGWSSVTNALDAVVGSDLETDAALRIRREEELRAQAGGSVPAIEAAILRVDGVTAAVVFENVTGATNADGLPPKSVEAVVAGGTDAAVREAIYDTKAAGIETYGAVTGSVNDGEGQPHAINFSRPATLAVYVDVSVLVDTARFPSNGADLIEAALVAWGDSYYRIGRDVVASSMYETIFAAAPGVLDVVYVRIGLAPSPGTSTTIAVGPRQIADLDTSRITVTTAAGSL